MEEQSIPYFRDLLSKNVQQLEHSCEEWDKICLDNCVPEDVLGEIRTTIGLARILMKQKLNQFKGLIDDSEFQTGEKEVTFLDLQGFWDMVYFEVEKMFKRFKELGDCRNNNWEFAQETTNGTELKKKMQFKPMQIKQTSSLKAHSIAARQRLAEAKRKIQSQICKQKDGDCFTVEIVHAPKEKLNVDKSNKQSEELTENTMKSIEIRKQQLLVPKESKCKPTDESVELLKGFKEIRKSGKEQDLSSEIESSKENVPSKMNHRKIYPNNSERKCKTEENVSIKTKAKSKRSKNENAVKLQCITRSAKKVLQSQENTL